MKSNAGAEEMSIKTTLFSVVKTALAGTIAVFLASGAVNADEQVLKAQRLLNALGFDPGPIDGSWGLKTESAMKKFLSDQNLVWDGSFDLEEFNFLEGKSKNYSAEKLITEAITLHDVGGWHMPIWNDGLYKTTIDRVARVVNANTVTVVDTHFIIGSSVNGYQIAYSPDTRDWTPTDEQWKLIGSYATKNNLNLQMLVMLHNEIGINKYEVEEHADKIGDVKFWDTYFAEYSRLVSKRAIVAELAGVDSIILGYNGAIDLGQNPKYWIKLIDDIKMSGFTGEIGLFTGLSVGNNWSGISDAVYRSSQKNVNKIISQFDFIVFQTQDIEKAGLSRVIRAHKKYKKPIHIMVITPSVVTGISRSEYIEPGMGENNATNSLAPYRDLSFETQNTAYQAIIDIINDPNFNYVTGVNSWGYAFRDDLFYSITRGDSDYQKSANIRGKPAEELVAHWYKLWQVDKEVVVAVEQPENAKADSLSDDDLCNKAIRLVFSSTGRAWKWSEELDALNWVDEAKGRRLSCGVVP